jgi:hypothetical protein
VNTEQTPYELARSWATDFLPIDASAYRSSGEMKGPGFLGPLQHAGGKTSTELSIGVNMGGKEVEIPSLVPTLLPSEVEWMLAGNFRYWPWGATRGG